MVQILIEKEKKNCLIFILEIIKEDPNEFTGHQLIDEEYLRSKGVDDFTKYRCMENYEPPKLNDIFLL